MNRNDSLRQLQEKRPWDVLIVGGGASGLGAAVESAARGYRTALVEQADFAQATSSRSTKLIHGGVRYLEQGNFSLVREALHERSVLLANAPALVNVLPFIIPLGHWYERFYFGAGLKLYDFLAGRRGLGRSHGLSARELRERLPGFAGAASGGILYWDAQFDDARLAIALAQTCAGLGGAPLNYTRVEGLLKEGGRVCGARVREMESGAEWEIKARVVVNATGIFTDELRRMDEPGAEATVSPSQGAHLVLPKKFLPGEAAILIPRTSDGRVLFAIPWQGRVLLGTTETAVDSPTLDPVPLAQEVEFLRDHARRFLGWPIGDGDILSIFAGQRPLLKGGAATARLSREHSIMVSPAGLVSVAGGKWTTYRRMAEDTMRAAAKAGGLPPREGNTARLALHRPAAAEEQTVRHAVREEMARTVEDVLARRTRALILDARAAMEAAPEVARKMAEELGRDAAWCAAQVAAFTETARRYLP